MPHGSGRNRRSKLNIARLAFRILLGRRLPFSRGTLEAPGVTSPVTIRRDGHGVPYIDADSDDDAWYGLGFCQGQDRAFQLEILLRVVRGTLSALVGAEGLPVDRLSRRIGFKIAAQQQLEVLEDPIRRTVEAFARGVTEGATLGSPRKAHEFTLLRTQPTAYTSADVLGIAKLLAFGLASNWDAELARLKLLSEDGPEAVAALDPSYPEWHHVTAPVGRAAGAAVEGLAEDLAALASVVGTGGASNNWVIAGGRTATGRPVLANDPHLPPTLPPHWYLAGIRTPGWHVAGATLAGSLGVIAGHSEVAAWGVTAGLTDNTDLFLEEIGPDGRSVRGPAGFVPCEVRREVIEVKGGVAVVEEVLVTPHGPIVSPALTGESDALSMRAVWLDARPIRGFITAHKADSFEEFRNHFAEWPLAPLNIVYADTGGTIGWQMIGEAPRRKKGWGAMPLPAWDPDAGWEDDTVAFEDMPHLANPEAGYVATANNKPAVDGNWAFLGHDWIDGYRVNRILQVLGGRRDWDVRACQELQADLKSEPWSEIKELVLAAPVATDRAKLGRLLLESWDGTVAADSAAATVFELLVAEMSIRVAKARAPRAWEWAVGRGFGDVVPHTIFSARRLGHLVRLLRGSPEGWTGRTWPGEVADALDFVVRRLQDEHGNDPAGWKWGSLRPLTLKHPVGKKAPFGRVFNLGPFPRGGDSNTVDQASAAPLDPTASPGFVASLRMVVDVGGWERSRFSLPGGQSGNPASRHSDDLLSYWLRGDGVPIAWSAAEVQRVARTTMRLEPPADRR